MKDEILRLLKELRMQMGEGGNDSGWFVERPDPQEWLVLRTAEKPT